MPVLRKDEHLMRTLNQYGIITAVSYPMRSEPEILAKFKDGTLWLVRITSMYEGPRQLTIANVLDTMSLHDKARNLQATPIICQIHQQKARFYHLSGRGPFAYLDLLELT
jgi:hypothetical protein